MHNVLKRQSGPVREALSATIGRGLRDRYSSLTKEALPKSFAALLVCLECAESVTRLKARVELLRRGLAASKR